MLRRAVVPTLAFFLAILPACRSGWDFEPSKTTAVGKDVEAAIQLLSTSTIMDRAAMMGAFALFRQHPQDQAMAELLPRLSDERPTKRRSAIYILHMLPWEDPTPALPKLRLHLTHPEAATRGMAATALGALGDRESTGALVRMLETDEEGYVRRGAAWALGELADREALAPLRAALEDSSHSVSISARNAIARLELLEEYEDAGPQARPVIQGIWTIAGSVPYEDVRLTRAVEMIRSVDPEIRRPLLESLAASQVVDIRNSALYAQGQLSGKPWKY
jgi:HEAT repeat protein